MDGILIIDKPAGITSHDVVMRVRRTLGTKQVGHTGTLDPFATGVMVLLIGNATRLARFIDKDEKEYEATIQFGFETDTGDITGSPVSDSRFRNIDVGEKLQTIDWENVFAKFRGDILQTPPMYSAKKFKGKKLYEFAREGVDIPREAVPVSIHKLELMPGKVTAPASALRIRVACSAGTYIRTLAEEIGREIGIGAHLTGLRRTRAGKFQLEDAITLDDLAKHDDPAKSLRPIDQAVEHLPGVSLSAERVGKARNGLSTRVDPGGLKDGSAVRMVDDSSKLIAIGVYDAGEKSVKPKIVLI